MPDIIEQIDEALRTMRLYFVAAEPGEANLDWFVVAENPEQAAKTYENIEEVRDLSSGDSFKIEIFDTGVTIQGPARPYNWHSDVPPVYQGKVRLDG